MANREQLEILKRSVEEWNHWREDHADIKPDLSKAALIMADLFEANLSEANLGGTDLSRANLTEADLSYANLRRRRGFK